MPVNRLPGIDHINREIAKQEEIQQAYRFCFEQFITYVQYKAEKIESQNAETLKILNAATTLMKMKNDSTRMAAKAFRRDNMNQLV